MDVISSCPLRVTSVVWQPRHGAWALTAIIKATYRLEPLCSPLADVQETPLDEDDHWDDDPKRSLSAASDLVPFKRRPEVLLVGHAFAPAGKPVRSLLVRLQVGDIDKAIEVWCDRVFSQDGQLLEGRPFTKMPLRWERAAGGIGTWNPVGMRFDTAPDMYGAMSLPNLQPPGRLLAWRGDTFEPIGFGPLSPTWPSRAGQLSPEAAAAWAARWFALPLAEGLDAGFFNAAPLDQQTAELRVDERIVLENLHPAHARLVTNLAGVKPRAMAERATGEREEVRLVADTLWIDTDRGIATLVWRGSIGLRERAEAGRIVVWADGEGRELVLPIGSAQPPQEEEDVVATMVPPLSGAVRPPVLPFGRPAAASLTRELPSTAMPMDTERPRESSAVGETMTAPILVAPPQALPFRDGAPDAWLDDEETTARAVLVRKAGDEAGQPWGPSGGMLSGGAAAPVQLLNPAPPWKRSAAPDAAQASEMPEPPAMIGPLATAEMAQKAAAVVTGEPRPEPPKAAFVAPVAESLPADELPVEQCAAIAASLARRKEDRAKILEEHELTPARWEFLNEHWVEEIRKETRRGKTGLMEAYDGAYVARLEEERGPITVEEYARLVVAGERANVDEVLDQLKLPRGAMMRITRVWLNRMNGDVHVAERVATALDAMREE